MFPRLDNVGALNNGILGECRYQRENYMAIHRIAMTERTREQLIAANAVVSKKRKGKHGHSVKCRTMLGVQKYPLVGRPN